MYSILHNFNKTIAFQKHYGTRMLKAVEKITIYCFDLCIYSKGRITSSEISKEFMILNVTGSSGDGYKFVNLLFVLAIDKRIVLKYLTGIY